MPLHAKSHQSATALLSPFLLALVFTWLSVSTDTGLAALISRLRGSDEQVQRLLEAIELHGLRLEGGSEPVFKIFKCNSMKQGG